MTRLQIDLPNSIVKKLERQAADEGVSVSEYVRGILEDKILDDWPTDFFVNVAGGWEGDPLERPDQGLLENREQF